MIYQPGPHTPPTAAKKRGPLRWIIGAVAIVIGLCVVGGVIAGIAGGNKKQPSAPAEVEPAAEESGGALESESSAPATTTAATTAPAKPAAKPAPTIAGDDLVHVGEDVPAGTYRVATGVDGQCYWKKTSDAEGSDIIANDIPSGGRPQVTLKNGQWFSSDGCPVWVKK